MAHRGSGVEDGYDYREEGASRLSLLAVIGLALSLACFVPGLGALGAALAALSLLLIARSGGRRRGTGMALIALSLGLASSVVWGVSAYKVTRFGSYYQRVVMTRAERLVDRDAAASGAWRAVMTKEASGATSDADYAQFAEAIRAQYGEFVDAPKDWSTIFDTFIESVRTSGNKSPRGSVESFPAPMRFTKGSAAVFVVFSKPTWMTEDLQLEDALALLPGRRAVTLRHNGPGKDAALEMRYQPVYGAEALPGAREGESGENAPGGSE